MKAAVVVFPGSNCDRDLMVAFRDAFGAPPARVWHKDVALPDGIDLIGLPGGFSFGDYLRPGAIAARSPIMPAVIRHAARGGYIFAPCNGWQIAIEAGMLPGALMRNAGLAYVCRDVHLRVETDQSPFTCAYRQDEVIRIPIAHHDGNFVASPDVIDTLEGERRVAFRYVDEAGRVTPAGNPNGSVGSIAGVLSENRRVLGMMPHPERLADAALGGDDGARLFRGLADTLVSA